MHYMINTMNISLQHFEFELKAVTSTYWCSSAVLSSNSKNCTQKEWARHESRTIARFQGRRWTVTSWSSTRGVITAAYNGYRLYHQLLDYVSLIPRIPYQAHKCQPRWPASIFDTTHTLASPQLSTRVTSQTQLTGFDYIGARTTQTLLEPDKRGSNSTNQPLVSIILAYAERGGYKRLPAYVRHMCGVTDRDMATRRRPRVPHFIPIKIGTWRHETFMTFGATPPAPCMIFE